MPPKPPRRQVRAEQHAHHFLKNFLPLMTKDNKRHVSLAHQVALFWGRRQFLLAFMLLVIAILLWRAVYLQIMDKDFLQNQGDARHVRTVSLPAYRGMIVDRHGEPLAASTAVESVWVNPKQFSQAKEQWQTVANVLEMSLTELNQLMENRAQKEFVYLKRHLSPTLVAQLKKMNIVGLFLQREYRRYYPTSQVAAHVVGFTNVDEEGQEGLEAVFEAQLKGAAGAKQIIQDRFGRMIDEAGVITMPKEGQNITISLDRRLQYVAHRELAAAARRSNAKAASMVILDVHSGEVLAMVNQPDYNPNNLADRVANQYRNRAVTDVFEPGSTMKPFAVVAALESGQYKANSFVNTSPGSLQFGKYTIRDGRNYGSISLATVLQKSSNVGAAKITSSLPAERVWSTLHKLGFGELTGSGFVGEIGGKLSDYQQWYPVDHATIAFGYGMNVTLLQLTRAYAALGNGGKLPPINFLRVDNPQTGVQIMQESTAKSVLAMLETVLDDGGTGTEARIEGYRVAGKTGTARKYGESGYSDRHRALFAGIVPASQPRLAAVVMLDEPEGDYYGGHVAAPVFAKVMAACLRLLNIPPDEK